MKKTNKAINIEKFSICFALFCGLIILVWQIIYTLKYADPFFNKTTLIGFILFIYGLHALVSLNKKNRE